MRPAALFALLVIVGITLFAVGTVKVAFLDHAGVEAKRV